MEIRTISWNVWGLNDIGKRVLIKGSLRRWKLHAVYLIETKMGDIDLRVINSSWGSRWVD